MSRIYRASVSFFGDLKSIAAPYRKLFGAYFALSLLVFIITKLVNISFYSALIGTVIVGVIETLLAFILFNAFLSDSKSFLGSMRDINPRILLNLTFILAICRITVNIIDVFRDADAAFFEPPIIQIIVLIIIYLLGIYEQCLLYFAAENPHEKVGTTLFGGILIMKKKIIPTFFLLLGFTLFTYFATVVITFPLVMILGTQTTASITPITSNIVARASTFFYAGVFVKLCSDA